MISEKLMGEEAICRDLESLSVSKRLVRSVSQRLKRQNHRGEGEEEDDDNGGVSFSCLTLYGRGGGCKVGADTGEEFGEYGGRRRSTSEEVKGYTKMCGHKETAVDCFSYGMKERFWRKNNRKILQIKSAPQDAVNVFLPDDILEMCLVRLPLTSLMNARLVCRKWRSLSSTSRFMQMRREGSYQSPWLFLFGVVRDGFCSGDIHALDMSLNQWHKIDAEIIRGRFLFSIASMQEDVYVVGGCSSLTNFGRVDRSSVKTHKGVFVFSPLTKLWRKAAAMRNARSSPILGVSDVSPDCFIIKSQQTRYERRFNRSRLGGVSDVYEDPHKLSLRRQLRHSLDENDVLRMPNAKLNKTSGHKPGYGSTNKVPKRYMMIAIGGLGSWDEPLDSGEIYDPVSNKWTDIPRLPVDFGVACSGVVCGGIFYVYSEIDKLAGFDVERGYWVRIQTTPSPPRVLEYYPKLVSCSGRLFMLSVSWCEGDGQIGRRNKAVRKLWELDLMYLSWREMSVHPDAPMDWNAAFVADRSLIFGVEMFKIFGQVLDFLTMFDVSDEMTNNWSHVSRNLVAHELDSASCMTKTMAVMHL